MKSSPSEDRGRRRRRARPAGLPAARARAAQRDYTAHLERGLHSRIPGCCIVFFLAVWLPLFHEGTSRPLASGQAECDAHHRAIRAAARRAGKPRPQYVPCRGCVRAGVFRRIHSCTAACKGKPGQCWTKRCR